MMERSWGNGPVERRGHLRWPFTIGWMIHRGDTNRCMVPNRFIGRRYQIGIGIGYQID